MLRLGLCCKFMREPIWFRELTAASLTRVPPSERGKVLSRLILDNIEALSAALAYCVVHGIGDFRIGSKFLPLQTHMEFGYSLCSLPESKNIFAGLALCRRTAQENNIRLTFHPDQFILLNSPRPEVVASSLNELRGQAELAELLGADVINIHGGGGYGDKPAALMRLECELEKLPPVIRTRLTLENDDRVFTPSDLLPVCRNTGIPLVYDIHHHRCLPDDLHPDAAAAEACSTWNREPLFHISSPRSGWGSDNPRPHHDFIDIDDFPPAWKKLDITVEIEAKSKEIAIARLTEMLETI